MTVSTVQKQQQDKEHEAPSSSLSSSLSTSQCPYAVALSEDEASHGDNNASHGVVPKQIAAEIYNCPAFRDGNKCPFKEAKSPEEVQKTLAQIPKSHHHKGAFHQVIQHLHHVHESGQDKGFVDKFPFQMGGQCPMRPYIKGQSFAQAFEDCSLAAIMGRLAADMEEEHDSDADEPDTTATARNTHEEVGVEEVNPVEAETTEPISNENKGSNPPASRNSLAEALKTGTSASHQAAEDVHFVRNFIRGIIDRELYEKLILSLYHVYVALEEALDVHAPKHFSSCHFPEALRRVPALKEDMEFWHNTAEPSPRTISPATQDYIERIIYLSRHDPLLLLSHSYTRYLGDLSGGKVLARVARRALDLDKDTGEGLAFYRFEKVSSYKQFKDNYRQALDELPLTSHQIQALVAEANVAFCLNMRLFQELDVLATIPDARVMSMEEVMSYARKGLEEERKNKENEEDKCPFLVNKKREQQVGNQHPVDGIVNSGNKTSEKRCPWPFIFAHDPAQGLRDWQTYAFLFVLVAVWLQCH